MQLLLLMLLVAAAVVTTHSQATFYRRLTAPTTARRRGVVQQQQAKVNIRPLTTTTRARTTTRAVTRGPNAPPLQSEDPWAALENMRGRDQLNAEEVQMLMQTALPGTDYPIMSAVPTQTRIRCDTLRQPGFYADPDYQCQVFRRCDPNGNMYGFLCPNTTLFNQISLTCDYFFNVDCSKAQSYYDYSNSRLYHENWPLLGNYMVCFGKHLHDVSVKRGPINVAVYRGWLRLRSL